MAEVKQQTERRAAVASTRIGGEAAPRQQGAAFLQWKIARRLQRRKQDGASPTGAAATAGQEAPLEPLGAVAPEHAAAADAESGPPVVPDRDPGDEKVGPIGAATIGDEAPEPPAGVAAARPVGQAVVLGGGTFRVTHPGDGLVRIAEKVYGSGAYWSKIKDANPAKVHGPGFIVLLGDTLVLPEVEVKTLVAVRGLAKNPPALRSLVCSMSDADFQGFLKGLSASDAAGSAQVIQQAEMMRATGMTLEEMSVDQKEYLEQEARRKGVSVGEDVKDRIERNGYGGHEASKWKGIDAADKKEWHHRFLKVINAIAAGARPDVQQIIEEAKARGGGFEWAPEETEKMEAFAFTRGDWKIYCGVPFVKAAEEDISRVYANISHELGGHNFYGAQFGYGIQKGALDRLPAAERATATSGHRSLHSAYGYMESEVFAELYEYRYDSEQNPTDHPFDTDLKGTDVTHTGKLPNDVANQLQLIHDAFSPTVARGLVAGLSRRVEMDPRILEQAKERYRRAVRRIFGP